MNQSSILLAGFAAGTVLHLLLLMLVGARPVRRAARRLDQLFFALFGALFLWHAGNLLALTLGPYEGEHRAVLLMFARMMAFTGLAVLSPLLVDVHLEYAGAGAGWGRYARVFYLPLLAAPFGVWAAAGSTGIPRGPWTTRFIIYFSAALLLSALMNVRLAGRAAGHLRTFHWTLAGLFVAIAAACVYAFLLASDLPALEQAHYLLMLSSVIPSALVGFWMFRFNFLEAGAQRMLGMALLAVAGLLAYVLVIERVAAGLERGGYLPAAVTQAVLVFVLIAAVEPIWRSARTWMSRQVSAEIDRVESLNRELQAKAVTASPKELRAFAEERISSVCGFRVRVSPEGSLEPESTRDLGLREAGTLRVLATHTAEALERSRLVAERVRLEHELAQREKMAALGEMVAFIAHRLKNPLSAINALVQVISEQSPEAAEHCEVIRGEIRRLDSAVADLLRYTRPAEARAAPAAPAEAVPALQALEEMVALFRPDAERKGVTMECQAHAGAAIPVRRDALHDILTSLLSNALEAAPAGSRVLVSCTRADNKTVLAVQDAGPGVAPQHREKIFQPFFTLKPGGTGLGLALAQRRAGEAGAEIRCISPAEDARGARFEVIFPD